MQSPINLKSHLIFNQAIILALGDMQITLDQNDEKTSYHDCEVVGDSSQSEEKGMHQIQ